MPQHILSSCWLFGVLTLLELAAIVRRQSHSSFDREFLHQVRGITRFGLLAIIISSSWLLRVETSTRMAAHRMHPVFIQYAGLITEGDAAMAYGTA